MMESHQEYEAVLPSLPEMLKQILDAAKGSGLCEKACADLELAAEEALVNIIHHGFPDQQPGTIRITCTANDGLLHIELSDDGMPYDPTQEAPPVDTTVPLEERQMGGYGVFFIEKLMDAVTYRYEDGRNVLTLEKSL